MYFQVVVAWFVLGASVAFGQAPKSLEPKNGLECLLVNRNSGRCLSVAEKSNQPGAKIVQGSTPDLAGPSERWTLLAAKDNAFRLKNEHSGLVLEIGKANKIRGVQAIQWHDQITKAHQQWTFELVDDAYLMRVGHTELVLGVAEGKMEDGARAIQWTFVPGVPDQLWELRSTKIEPAPVIVEQPEAERGTLWWMIGAGVGVAAVVVLAVAIVGILLLVRRRARVSQPKDSNADEAKVSTPCTGCGRMLQVNARLVGKKVRCARCGQTVRVPAE